MVENKMCSNPVKRTCTASQLYCLLHIETCRPHLHRPHLHYDPICGLLPGPGSLLWVGCLPALVPCLRVLPFSSSEPLAQKVYFLFSDVRPSVSLEIKTSLTMNSHRSPDPTLRNPLTCSSFLQSFYFKNVFTTPLCLL